MNLFKSKGFKIFRAVFNILIFFIMVCFAFSVCLQRISNNKISILNYRVFTVITESMTPKYKIGDVLIAKKTNPDELKVGDVVTYQGEVNSFKDKVVTHQIIKIEKNNGKYYYHTKGLANLVEDPIISEDQIYGKVIHKSIILSSIYKIIGTSFGFYIFIIIPILYLVTSEIIITLLEREEERRKK